MNNGDRTLVGLFSDLWRETSTLVHDEVELARAEVSEKVGHIGNNIAVIVTAAAVLFAGFLVLLLAAVNALMLFIPGDNAAWIAPLIVGAVVAIIGLIALAKGRAELKASALKPERTVESLRRDRDLVKEHVK
jgi:uncharacterized membrane protein YqjE